MWTVTFAPQKEQVGTLTATWTGALPEDTWESSTSVDLSLVKDLTPYAAKLKSMKMEYDTAKAKPAPYQPALDALAAALNGGK